MGDLAGIHDSEEVKSLAKQVDEASLERELGGDRDFPPSLHKLQMAAQTALAQEVGDKRVEHLIEDNVILKNENIESDLFLKWSSYLEALIQKGEEPSIDDLFFYCVAGFYEGHSVEVRNLLDRLNIKGKVGNSVGNEDPWGERVRKSITCALLLLISQNDHSDINLAGDIVSQISEDQDVFEDEWLQGSSKEGRDATVLLGLYHLAQAVLTTSEFLLSGSVSDGDSFETEFQPELKRLLLRAEEYLSLSSDLETILWLNSVAIIVEELRASSTWAQGRGVSEGIDQFLDELAKEGRAKPIFSLLPSQQEALRQNLLDPSRVAVVLQMPTSSGKTLLAEFAILQAIEAYNDARIAYVTPTRALATQVRRDLTHDLSPLGIDVTSAGSSFEEDPYELELLEDTDGVVVATPEKLDLLLRSEPKWFEDLRLVVVDEAHLLDQSERGARLELLLANLRREHPDTRLLLLTPFMENASSIASWLGDERGNEIEVHWRPSRLILGMTDISGRGSNRSLEINWTEPHNSLSEGGGKIDIPTDVPYNEVDTTRDKVIHLTDRFSDIGTILALFSASKVGAEKAARERAESKERIAEGDQPPSLRLAIALARSEYGSDSRLASCLEHGVAFHHSSISPALRFLIEDQVREGTIDFVAATTTLARGMNFPVSMVLIHSVHKPYGRGDLTSAEFWNIAGRAGRVGFTDKGIILFANNDHKDKFDRYRSQLNNSVVSAIKRMAKKIIEGDDIKVLYRDEEELRPFIQYLAHAAAKRSPEGAMAIVEQLVGSSLASKQIDDPNRNQALRSAAREYISTLTKYSTGYLKAADQTGLGSFSFDELYSKIGDDPILESGPGRIRSLESEGYYHLVDAIKDLPELGIAIGRGSGPMNVQDVSEVVEGWIQGQSVHDLSEYFPGDSAEEKVRKAAKYLFSDVSGVLSWGAHAYTRGWQMQNDKKNLDPEELMLGSYIEHGVSSPEAAIASMLGVPRQFAEPITEEYRSEYGKIDVDDTSMFRGFVESMDEGRWESILERAGVSDDISGMEVKRACEKMQGNF